MFTFFAVSQFRGHKNSTFYIRSSISVDNRYLLTGSSDANAYIYAVDEPFRPPSVLQGHGEEVSSGQWHPCDPGVLVTFSDDCRFRTWRFKNEAYQCSKHNEVGYAYLHEPGNIVEIIHAIHESLNCEIIKGYFKAIAF